MFIIASFTLFESYEFTGRNNIMKFISLLKFYEMLYMKAEKFSLKIKYSFENNILLNQVVIYYLKY